MLLLQVLGLAFLIIRSVWTQSNNACKNLDDYYTAEINKNCRFIPEMTMTTPEIIMKFAGKVESFEFTTEDGYILTMFRIPREQPNKGTVLLQHPVTTNSVAFLITGTDSLAINLWRAGYDVWLNNQRGTQFSEKHVNLTVLDLPYWDWTFDEIAKYEVPSEIKLIRSKTNNSQIIYYGHSMSSSIALAYASLRPQQAKKYIKIFILVGTPAFYKYQKGPIIGVADQVFELEKITKYLEVDSVPIFNTVKKIAAFAYRTFPVMVTFAQLARTIFVGYVPSNTDYSYSNFDATNYLHNFSLKSLFHMLQLMKVKTRFQKYDYGTKKNLEVYGTQQPPEYPLGNILVPTLLVYSAEDLLTGKDDTLYLYGKLSKAAQVYGNWEIPGFAHLDHFLGLRRRNFTDQIIGFIDTIK